MAEVLGKGARLTEREGVGPVTFFVLEGEVRFEAAGEIVYLQTGQLLITAVQADCRLGTWTALADE